MPPKGYPLFNVPSGAVKNQSLVRIVKTGWLLIVGLLASVRLLVRERPAAIVGVGGYISVPVVVAGFLLRMKIFLQEQNASVGIANRFLGKLSRKVFLGFDQAKSSFAAKKCVVTGNPLRREFYEAPPVLHDFEGKRLLILGGSQGAKAINEVMMNLLAEILSKFPGTTFVHQTGASDAERVEKFYAENCPGPYEVRPFISDMLPAYQVASLVIARSGALTVSELIQVGRPAILVPYPRKGQNDQTANAYLLETRGAARVVEQGDGFQQRFWTVFQATFRPEALKEMARQISQLRKPNALATIVDHIESDLSV